MRVTFARYTLRFRHTFRVSGARDRDVAEIGIVKLDADGVIGYGEAAPSRFWGEDLPLVEKTVQKLDLGKHESPLAYEVILKEVEEQFHPPRALLAALDMALFDCIGKKMNIPIQKFFDFQDTRIPQTSFTIGYADLDIIEQKAKEAEEYPILKLKLGTSNDIEIVEKVRALTSKPVRVDANEGWGKEEALEKIIWLQTQNVELVEQPLPHDQIEETRWLRERVRLPLFADESIQDSMGIRRVAEAFDGINIKLMKCGGILEAITMVRRAREHGLKIMIGCMTESSLGIAAAANLLPLVDYADLDSHLLVTNDPFEGLTLRDGRLILSARPGLGVTPKDGLWDR